MAFIIFYLLIINIVSFCMMGLDKHLAKKQLRRIPERDLFTMGFIGGGPGLFLGSKKFRHKTMKRKFIYGLPIISLINVSTVTIFIVLLYR